MLRPRFSLGSLYPRVAKRLPWWAVVLIGAASVGAGAALTAKPFTSLRVLVVMVSISLLMAGIGELLVSRREPLGWLAALGGVAMIAAGSLALAWPGITVGALALLAGITLVADGLARLASAFARAADDRFVSLVSGLSRAILGALALSWPDVTVLVVALLVGPATVVFGLSEIADGLLQRRANATTTSLRWPPVVRAAGVSVSFVFVLALLGLSAIVHESQAGPDDFYRAPDVLPRKPGVLLRSEPFERGVPNGARAWRILYTTTRSDSEPAVASAVVLAPALAGPRGRPVVAWAHATSGIADSCAPSVLASGPFEFVPALAQLLEQGWVLVATDYVGLGTAGAHPYLVGEAEARSVLDSVRAARQLDELWLDDRTVVWGHSQGGHAALWAGIIGPRYAPDVELAGVAAISPAAGLVALVDRIKDTIAGRVLGVLTLDAYSQAYPEIEMSDYVRPDALVLAREIAGRCLRGPALIASAGVVLPLETSLFSGDVTSGPLVERLRENTPDAPIDAPLLIAHGDSDEVIRPELQRAFVNRLCRAGQTVDFRTYKRQTHLSIVTEQSPLGNDLVAWTWFRFEGIPTIAGCRTVQR